jgi:hypothetical protein
VRALSFAHTRGRGVQAISTMGVGMTDRSAEAAGGGFVRHAVDIPAEAQSQATHLRWRQLPLKGPGCVLGDLSLASLDLAVLHARFVEDILGHFEPTCRGFTRGSW